MINHIVTIETPSMRSKGKITHGNDEKGSIYINPRHGVNPRFRWAKAPTRDELTKLTHTIAHRVGRYLEREGLLERDAGTCYLTPEAIIASEKVRPGTGREAGLGHEDPSNHLLGSSITYRIAVGPQQGRKAMTLQTLADCGDDQFTTRIGKVAGFSLHAGVATKAHDRAKLERLCRYITRPAVSTKRLLMTWAKRLKRVFSIEIETCSECGADVRIIASIEDPAVIEKILTCLYDNASSAVTSLLPDCRASPNLPVGLFD